MKKLLTTVAIISMASSAMANQDEADDINDAITTAYSSLDSTVSDDLSNLFDTFITTTHGEESESTGTTYSISLSGGKLTASEESFDYTSGIVYSTASEVTDARDDLIAEFNSDMLGIATDIDNIVITSNGESGADLRYTAFTTAFGLIGGSIGSVVDEHSDMQLAALDLIEEFTTSTWSNFDSAVSAFSDDLDRHNDAVDDYLAAIDAINDATHVTE